MRYKWNISVCISASAAVCVIIFLSGAFPTAAQTPAAITLNPSTTYQTMTGWEATAQAGHQECPGFTNHPALFDDAVNDLGLNRLRLELRANAGGLTFNLQDLDRDVRDMAVPMRQRLAARGERLFVNVCFVGRSELNSDADRYAQQVLAAYQHLEQTFGWVPDGWEVALEPGYVSPWWSEQSMARAIVAAGKLLKENNYDPYFIAPSNPGGPANALAWFDTIARHTPSVFPYLKELSYHRYDSAGDALAQIAARGAQYRIGTAMLEHIAADQHELHSDLKIANVSAWQQYTLAYCVPTEDGSAYYYLKGNSYSLSAHARVLRQYFKFIRAGAVRIDAQTTNSSFDPVAFINADGGYTVVVKAAAGGSFSVANLPAGVYGIKHTTRAAYDRDEPDVTIGASQTLAARIPGEGVVTIYRKAGTAAGPRIQAVVNAASYEGGGVAPGEIVVIFGGSLAAGARSGGQITADNRVARTLSGTTVTFGGAPAPLLYLGDNQINAVVPYSLQGSALTEVQVRGPGGNSEPLSLPVRESAPALFTADGSGRGQAAAINQDNTANSSSNPALKGSVIAVFGTGAGENEPPGSDGKLAAEPLGRTVLPVSVLIGGVAAPVRYDGDAPGLVAGVIQVNASIPLDAPSGDAVPIELKVGSYSSPAGVTIAVR
jgi:uncharacterized protein (TIGR03437 family)